MIVIVDYGLGNLFSVKKAFEYLGAEVCISSNPEDLKTADRLVLPGVGAFGDGIKNLENRGLAEVLKHEVLQNKKPLLGICLGLQLLGDVGFEFGEHKGLGLIPGKVEMVAVGEGSLKLPHIGWNTLAIKKPSALLAGVKPTADFYFLHSFHLKPTNAADIVATTSYGEEIIAAVERGNIFATQFHPEKSQGPGLKILENFLEWQP